LLENVPKIKDVRSAARGFGSDVADAAGKAVAVAGKAIETPARARTVRAVSFFGGE
jgi:hypothetical protein